MRPRRTGLLLLALLLAGAGGLAWWLGRSATDEGIAGAGGHPAGRESSDETTLTAEEFAEQEQRVEAADVKPSVAVDALPLTTESEVTVHLLVRGRLFDPDNTPVSGGVRYDVAGRELYAATNELGEFVVPNDSGNDMVLTGKSADWLDSKPVSVSLETRDVHVDLHLRRGGRITGEVLDDEGKPMPDEDISVGGLELGGPDVTSDEDGCFVIEHVEPGDYFFLVVPKGNDELEHMLLANATVVEGETTHVVIGGVNENKIEVVGVVTRGGKPHKTQLIFMSVGPDYMATMRIAEADRDGRYSVTLLRPGATRVLIEGSKGNATFLFDARPSPEPVEFNMEIPSGRVTGRILDPTDALVSGEVSIGPRDGCEDGLGDATQDFHDANGGTFEFDDLRPGRYVIRAKTDAFGRGLAEVEVPASEEPVSVEVHVSLPSMIKGLVRGVDSNPLQGATVVFFDANGNNIERMHGIRTDSRGQFEVSRFPEGQLFAYARRGEACSPITPLVASSDLTAEIELFLEPGAFIDLRAADASGAAVPAALSVTDAAGRSFAELWRARDEALASMARNGRLVGPLQPGTYDVRAVHRDGRKSSRRVTVKAGDAKHVTLQL